MRLLHWISPDVISLTDDLSDDIPKYAILSHTWASNTREEVTFEDLSNGQFKNKSGWQKIEFCGKRAREDDIQYFWVDTCCINKASLSELSEAITSMFRWYQNAEKCYVYLPDVFADDEDWESDFQGSRWFTRGWTLQELLAPKIVEFFSTENSFLGTKHDLAQQIHETTTIPLEAINGLEVSKFSVNERLRWAERRMTKKKEDRAYCLLGIFNVYMPLIYGEGDNAFARLQEELDRTRKPAALPKAVSLLRTVQGAVYDARDQIHRACHPGTRVELLQEIQAWALHPGSKPIFWVNGMAGTGKSTISFTVAQWLDAQPAASKARLGATFFFKRGEADRASASLLFPTLAAQISVKSTDFDEAVADAVVADPSICNKALSQQFEKLIRTPGERIQTGLSQPHFVILLDALDECQDQEDISTILKLWATMSKGNSPFRLFITSRPELAIRLGFKKMANEVHQDTVLHEVPQPVIEHDIEAYLTSALREIREDYNLEPLEDFLDAEWPGFDLLQSLISLAVPLFIIAVTMVRFVREATKPKESLDLLIRDQSSSILQRAGRIYSSILRASTTTLKVDAQQKRFEQTFSQIVGAIITLAEPLSRKALANLLGMPVADVSLCLQPLHSVLQIPAEDHVPIRPFHLSFPEYLVSHEAQSTPYGVDSHTTHEALLQASLRLMSSSNGLRENICRLTHPGQARKDISLQQIQEAIPPELRYACRYWISHLVSSGKRIRDNDEVHTFLQHHFFHWLEVCSLIGQLSEAINHIAVLQSQIHANCHGVAAFLADARRFLLVNRSVLDQAPLQVYSSATIFAPQSSKVRQICGAYPEWIVKAPAMLASWNATSLTIDCGSRILDSVLSTNRTILATLRERDPLDLTPFRDRTETYFSIRIWNLVTGEEVQEIISVGVHRMAFMPCDRKIAVLTKSGTLNLWNIKTGIPEAGFATAEGDRTAVTQLETGATLHDGELKAAVATLDWFDRRYIISIWDAAVGHILRSFDLRNSRMSYLAKSVLSPDASLVALYGSELQVRDILTQDVLLTFKHPIRQVLFSRNSPVFVAELEDGDTCFWDTKSWTEVQRLKTGVGRNSHMRSLALSPDGLKFAYCYNSLDLDLALEVWDVKSSAKMLSRRSTLNYLQNFCFVSDTTLALVDSAGAIVIWDLSASDGGNYVFSNSKSTLTTAVMSKDHSLIAVGFSDGNVSIRWVQSTDQPVPALLHTPSSVERTVFAPGNTLLAVYSFFEGRSVWTLWDIWTGDKLGSFMSSCLAFSPDASYLVAETNRGISAQTIHSQERMWDLQQPATYLRNYRSISFSDNGLLIVVTFGDVVNGAIEIRQARTGRLIRKIQRKTDKYYIPAKLSPSGALLALQFPKLSGYESFDCFQIYDVLDGIPFLEIQPTSGSQGYFLKNENGLQTDEEIFYFDRNNLDSAFKAEKRTDTIYQKNDWIRYGQHNLLWLGPDYRSRRAITSGDKILIVLPSGDVEIVQFDVSKLVGSCSNSNRCSECDSENKATFRIMPPPEMPNALEEDISEWDPILTNS